MRAEEPPTRIIALIDRRKVKRPSSNVVGLPAGLAQSGGDADPLPLPDVLLIKEQSDGIFLVRYTAPGQLGGDTWHETIDDATAQAEFEYGNAVGAWSRVPHDVDDPDAYAVRAAEPAAR